LAATGERLGLIERLPQHQQPLIQIERRRCGDDKRKAVLGEPALKLRVRHQVATEAFDAHPVLE